MVQVLRAVERGPSFGERLGAGLGAGVGAGINSTLEKKQQAKLLAQENKYLKDNFDIDLEGIQNPEARKAIIAEQLRSSGKQKLLDQKEQMFGKIFQPKQDQKSKFSELATNGAQAHNQEDMLDERQPQQQFDASQLSDEDILEIGNMDPNLGRLAQHSRDVSLRESRSEREFQEKQRKSSPEFQREQKVTEAQAQADVKYNQQLQESSKQHELKKQSLDRLEALNKKGVTGKPFEKLLEKFGLVALTSDGRREFAADVKNLITDIRSILGSQFSTFEFQTILNAFPSPDFNQDANEAIIKNLKVFEDIRSKELEIAQQMKKENGGKLPIDYQSKVNESVREYADTKMTEIKENTRKIMNEEFGIRPGFVLMFDPQGEPLEVSPDEIDKYTDLGASLP